MGNQNLGALAVSINSNRHNNRPEEQLHDILDFSKISQKQMYFPSCIIEKNNEIQIIPQNKVNKKGSPSKILYRVQLQGFNKVFFTRVDKSGSNALWKYLPSEESQQIKVGDTLKLGNLELQLIFFAKNNGQADFKGSQSCDDETVAQKNSIQCKICLKVDDKPLVSLCQCAKYSHYECLRQSIKKNITEIQSINYSYFEINSLKCDKCHKELPLFFSKNQDKIQLLSSLTDGSYAIFQSKNATGNKNKKSYYLIKLNNGVPLTLGRGSDSQIQINNSTVSRSHLLFYYLHKKLYVRDLKSKYGSLHYSPLMHYYFNVENGTYLWLKENIIKINLFDNSWIPMQLPKTCCAASLNIDVHIFENENDRLNLQNEDFLFENDL